MGVFFIYEKFKNYEFQKRYKNSTVRTYIKTGNLNRPRSNHSCIKLKDGNVLVSGGKEKYYNNAKHLIQIYTINLNDKKYINQNVKNIDDFYSYCFQYLYRMESICNYDKNNFLISGGQTQTPLNTRIRNSVIVKLQEEDNLSL